MRIIAGTHKGRRLATPKGQDVRPTSDRVRQALFNVLDHGLADFSLAGAHVLDLFAGTGALGLEALSRGAASCVFVDNAAASRALIQDNITTFGFGGAARIFRRDATDLGHSTQSVVFDLVLADPPYGCDLAARAIASALAGGWLADSAVVVIEQHADAAIDLPDGLIELDRRRYADTHIIIARRAGGH